MFGLAFVMVKTNKSISCFLKSVSINFYIQNYQKGLSKTLGSIELRVFM